MLIALLADIHANREAFAACLAEARRLGAERFALLGDIVGYGADPCFAVDLAARLVEDGAIALRGNHDQAIGDSLERMNSAAAQAIVWTRAQLDAAQRSFLSALPYTVVEDDTLFTHANGWNPKDFEYVRTTSDAERSLRATTQRLTLCGHTHVPAVYLMSPLRPPALFEPVTGRDIPLVASHRWLAVLGSVGQPRDGNPAASFSMLDTRSRVLRYLRVPYDVDAAARKVREAGLPESLAARLSQGR